MNKSIAASAWSGMIAMMFMFGAIISWQIFPPPSPSLPMAEWAAHFTENRTGVFVGSVLMCIGSSLFFPFFGGFYGCLKVAEGKHTPLTYGMMMIVPFGFLPLFLVMICFVTAAYRPEMSTEMTAALADAGMFLLVIPGFIGLVQWVVTGIIILRDVNPQPIFPRWLGYANIWVGILAAPGSFIPFFKTGPFAWNGVFAFWVPVFTFGMLLTAVFWAMLRAAKHPAMQQDQS
jgi:hypothetical protein